MPTTAPTPAPCSRDTCYGSADLVQSAKPTPHEDEVDHIFAFHLAENIQQLDHVFPKPVTIQTTEEFQLVHVLLVLVPRNGPHLLGYLERRLLFLRVLHSISAHGQRRLA